jgi:hypothetical protein
MMRPPLGVAAVIFNSNGEVIGVNSAYINGFSGAALVFQSESLRPLLGGIALRVMTLSWGHGGCISLRQPRFDTKTINDSLLYLKRRDDGIIDSCRTTAACIE